MTTATASLITWNPGQVSVEQCVEVLRPSGELGWPIALHSAVQCGIGADPRGKSFS